jgi:pseudouridine synthase
MLKTGKAKIEIDPLLPNRVEIKISEGKKRQIRYMFKNFNYSVLKLWRVAYGPLSIKGTAKGELRELKDGEVRKLKAVLA